MALLASSLGYRLAMVRFGRRAVLGAGLGAVVLLEDLDEPPYRVDRMITQLLRAGWFTGVTGIALGSWVPCGEPSEVYEGRC
jgi:muramoyltetrapeptide carboxypeptidase LdcA involved in peptidoglycan recycling